jgi:rfaE bifunctional protein kinase chain/domain
MANDATSTGGRLASLVRGFGGRRVLVVGDLLADRFVYGEISRVSREAPVLILRHERTETVPGGAANCAANLAALGARTSVVGVVGEDEAGVALLAQLGAAGVDCSRVVRSRRFMTTTKERILAGQAHSTRQQVIRVDYESPPLEDERVRAGLASLVAEAARSCEAVVVSDYNYGVACEAVIAVLRELATRRSAPVLVDSRFRLLEFSGFTSATPNEDEVEHVTGRRFATSDALEEAGHELRARLGFDALLVTRGSHGMMLVEDERQALHIEPVGAREAVDVTGAGDTVIATYALALASGATPREAAQLANHAGGLVVMKRGTASVTAEELLNSLHRSEAAGGAEAL